MTDKSFGDHYNRNVVKNPLLSTAVTGLSIEDLTHNAVLLPVSLSQEVITQPEQQNRPQTGALQHTEHAVSSYPAGDTNSNICPPQLPPTNSSSTIQLQKPLKTQETYERPMSTMSKASVKSEDDFDVNEYFARLHGTRYVSAPFNIALKEDKNANLEATEENLEEINLNEPEKQVDVQQSLTADIAQNFSQLPTMLPQVASAVFSSFSNMLQTRKSREPTPEVSSGYQEVHFERPSEPKEIKEVLPPPKDPPKEPLAVPPSLGTSNYRLPPKKKYAQIPGLSSGDKAQSPCQQFGQSLPPTNQNIPQYFVPPSLPNEQNVSGQQNIKKFQNINLIQTQTVQKNTPSYFTPAAIEDISKQKTDMEIPNTTEKVVREDVPNFTAQNIPDTKSSKRNEVNVFSSSEEVSQTQFCSQDPSQTSVLPPPPMFANQPRRDSQTAAGKSFLPPSVARRIGANQPIIKQAHEVPSFTENIFIPASIDSDGINSSLPTFPQTSKMSMQPPSSNIQSAYTPFDAQTSLPPQFSVTSSMNAFGRPIDPPPTSIPAVSIHAAQPLEKTSIFPLNSNTISGMTKPTDVSGPPSSILMHSSVAPPPSFATSKSAASPLISPSNYQPDISMSTNIAAGFSSSNAQALNQIPSSTFPSPSSITATVIPSATETKFQPKTSTMQPQIFTPANDFVSSNNLVPSSNSLQGTMPPPPILYGPNVVTAETKEFPPIDNLTTPAPKPPKSVPEPPKSLGPINYRMTKKRPQYYAGPIEGVGAISNNVKPVITPVNTGSFQGALFTPQQKPTNEEQAAQNTDQYSQQTPFDISRPAQHSNEALQPQVEDYNTAFDMSRPVTESYDEPKPQSSGFGLLGSLKSKLGALDINKIQSTVTTFFDPAYNNAKKESSNVHDHVTYGQQQYGNTHNSNFEIFVPNIEQAAPAYGYISQTPYESGCYINYPSQSYQNSQTPQQYYQSSEQNVSNYFSDADMHRYQAVAGGSIPNVYTATGNQEIIQNQEYHTVPKSQEEINASRQPDIEIQRSYSIRPPYQRNEQLQNLVSTVTSKLVTSTSVAHVQKPQIFDPTKVSTDTNNLFNNPLSNVDSPKDIMPSGRKEITDTVSLGLELLTKNSLDQMIPLKNSTTTLYHYQPNETLNQLHAENVTHKTSTDRAHSFFDNPSLETLSKEVPILQNVITQPSSANREVIFGAAASFFDSTPKDNINEQVNKNIGLPKNVGYEISRQSNLEQETANARDGEDHDLQNVMSSLQTDPSDFFSSLNPGDSKIQSIFSSAFDFNKSEMVEQQSSKVITDWPEQPRLDMSSAPLFGLSTMLANKTKELHDLETEMQNLSVQESANEASYMESLKTEKEDDKDNGSELNICETCREVNKPDEWEREETDDLTSQLIDNITSPIQLSNPVEVPLTERNTPANEDLEDFDRDQYEEISHITEETIEAIQVKAATELLDDDQKVRDYGWSTEPVAYSIKLQEERDLIFEQPTGLEQHNYGLPNNPNAIGFFGNKALYENIPDKLKKDFESQENVARVLPRQMSVPTAPPEEDTKSDALDVHSIEQDASKDFPIFEEFVIEPDIADDKSGDIEKERKKIDSFSSRVDKYKKKEENETFPTNSPTFKLTSTTSPTILPSYFDTGNYAADTHYRNSLSSPANFTFGSQNQISVPPGFEEEFQRRLSTHDALASKIDEPFIPETSTQTKVTYSPTFSTAHHETCVTTASTISTIHNRGSEIISLPDFKSIFGVKKDVVQEYAGDLKSQQLTNPDQKTLKKEDNFPILGPKVLDFGSHPSDEKEKSAPAVSIFETPKSNLESGQTPLPDPIKFFASSSEPVQKHDIGVNRLASYFSSSEKPDHSKSFFELSQSQNHYRQPLVAKSSIKISPVDSKPLINSNLTAFNFNDNKLNIPHEQYVANLNLMSDLTSIQQAEFKPEQVVRTVNYFTIEYDNERIINDIAKNLCPNKGSQFDNNTNPTVSDGTIDDGTLITALNKCKYCCDLTVGHVEHLKTINHEFTDFKVKKCMDGNRPSKKTNNMENKENSLELKTSTTVNIDNVIMKEEPNDGVSVATETKMSSEYTPVRHHWFYRIDLDGKSNWRGFSVADSQALENAYQSPNLNDSTVVATDGGRFDVNINGRLRVPVYWNDNPTNVRRCSWFYKGTTDARYVPYTEPVAEKLEEEYRHGMTTGEWHRRLVLPNNEMVVMHGPAVMVHFLQSQNTDAFSAPPPLPQIGQLFTFGKRVYRNPPKIRVTRNQTDKIDHLIMLVHGAGEYRHQREKIQSAMRPRVVRRGHDESEIEEMEPSSIDHLLLLCHGVGSACDMRFRNVEEVVDDFRATSLQLIQSHYKESYDSGRIGRVEVLPISWHATLHSGESGVDTRLARITLESIPRLRSFTNDTVLDVLFYTSPVFCQTIINTVCAELNRIYKLFRERNPDFKGGVSLGGHSLGSVIIYDLLCHQMPKEMTPSVPADKRYVSGAAGTGQPTVQYPTLDFAPIAMYALGSPIAIFECIRGVEFLGAEFSLPTCKNFFNVFHPYDPIAYRIEPLINPALREYKPFLIPHHKGRKRMHLELKDTMARVGADLKQKLLESLSRTWSSMWKSPAPAPDCALEKVVEEELEKDPLTEADKEEQTTEEEPSAGMLGRLNGGRRVDYVLQEAPFEMINEYLFAMSSHVCYWESEDTMLLMLREIYDALGVRPDHSVPQHSLSVERRNVSEDAAAYTTTDFPSTSKGPS